MSSEYVVDFLEPLTKNNGEGNVMAVKGANGSGKSYFISCLTRMALTTSNFSVAASVLFKDETMDEWGEHGKNRLRYITCDRDLFQAYIDLPPPLLVLLDDLQTKSRSTNVTGGHGQAMTSLSLFFRKFQSTVVYIVHLDYIPKYILGQNPTWLYKLDKRSVYVPKRQTGHFYNEKTEIKKHCVRVPYASWFQPLPYETYGIPSFDITLDLEDMWHYLSKPESIRRGLRESVRAYLELAEKRKDQEELAKVPWKRVKDIIEAKLAARGQELDPKMKLYKILPREVMYGTEK